MNPTSGTHSTNFTMNLEAHDPSGISELRAVYQIPNVNAMVVNFECDVTGAVNATCSVSKQFNSAAEGTATESGVYAFKYIVASDNVSPWSERNHSIYYASGNVTGISGVETHLLSLPDLVID